MKRPDPTEYAAFYGTYVDAVPGDDVLQILPSAPDRLAELLVPVTSEAEQFAYAAGKWSIREVLGHVVDAERMFAYRALHFARGAASALPGIDSEEWAATSNAGSRPLAEHLAEFRELRAANVRMFASFDEDALARRGTASGAEVSVGALIFIVAGHELHHRGILRERYLPGLARA